MAELDVDRFFKRIGKLHSQFIKHNDAVWNKADCLVLSRGKQDDDAVDSKSAIAHRWLFGYELPDTILLIRKDGSIWFLGTTKKTEFLRQAVANIPRKGCPIKEIRLLIRNKEDNNAHNFETLWEQAGIVDGSNRTIGILAKEHDQNKAGGACVGPFETRLSDASNQITLVDIASGLSFCMSVKDDLELDLMRKSSVLSNKIMKHGFVVKMESVIDQEKAITHEQLAQYIEDIIEDPSIIKLKVPKDDVTSCYFPSIHSGGDYDMRLSAVSNNKELSHDVITVSIGAKYKNYSSNIARTYLVDPPKKLSETYEALLELQEICIDTMKPGNELREVHKAAVRYLQSNPKHEHLVEHLPKNLGFCTGLDFREAPLLLSPKNMATFKKGMVFSLILSFHNVPLSKEDRSSLSDKSSTKKLENYSLLLSDMIVITSETADVLTKLGKTLTDVAYNINETVGEVISDDDESEDEEDANSDEVPSTTKGDKQLARKLARESSTTGRKSTRLAQEQASAEASEGAAKRLMKQVELMKRRNEERLREQARANRKKDGGESKTAADELEVYKRTRDFPDSVQPNQVKVDMVNQCVLLPICGIAVPFHISTIKNVVMPDADNVTLLRINFYTPGVALGKEAPANMVKLVQKYAPYASFIREMTFRSLDGHNLTLAFRQISELRKRERQKEITEQEEANLVKQEKLVRTKNERVPRLADLTMRPAFAGRKTQGNLEAHTNGLRFISTRNELVDIMYENIKYAVFQPCENEIMVLIHFHLKNPIMVGKKRHSDVQFFTEVVDASSAVDNSRRSMYDPDEMDDEQRERQLRKRLNQAFKEFCKKVDAVAKNNGHGLEFEIPYRDLGFTGNPHKEMVTIMPTLSCLVNLTETPFFVVDLQQVDHVHFERISYMSKAFDIVLINKDFKKSPWRIDMISNDNKESIQEWLTDMEITFTEGPMNLNWKQIMATIADDDRFYMDTEDDEVTSKPAGWEFLRMSGDDEDEEGEDPDADDSEFDEDKEESEGSEASESEEEFDSEDDEDDFDEDAEDELEEQGLDWDEMEAKAASDDKRKRALGEDVDEDKPQRTTKKHRRR
ncbi:hypothetical protein MPSEU_000523200 [Mayamaea pseudoterrestris]|nr:hypothetical protein MPSEU_000523200 [Mayamaea pseudoterrestris]